MIAASIFSRALKPFIKTATHRLNIGYKIKCAQLFSMLGRTLMKLVEVAAHTASARQPHTFGRCSSDLLLPSFVAGEPSFCHGDRGNVLVSWWPQATMATSSDQAIALTTGTYLLSQVYKLRIRYKLLKVPTDNTGKVVSHMHVRVML